MLVPLVFNSLQFSNPIKLHTSRLLELFLCHHSWIESMFYRDYWISFQFMLLLFHYYYWLLLLLLWYIIVCTFVVRIISCFTILCYYCDQSNKKYWKKNMLKYLHVFVIFLLLISWSHIMMDTPIHRYPYSQIPPIHRFHLYTYTDTPNTQIPLYMDVTPIHRYPYTQIPPIHRFHLYTDTSYTQIPHIHRYLIYTDTSYT
mgnify:CR=1 FL=1